MTTSWHPQPGAVEALRALGVLDTPPEPSFDEIVAVAARLLDVPIALVSLLDDSRQWFKARIGLDVAETDRRHAFCAHAVSADVELFEIRDARRDPRFASNPLVTGEPHIRFYAGCPLRAPNGERIGTLCVIDRKERTLSEKDQQVLASLAQAVEHLLRHADPGAIAATPQHGAHERALEPTVGQLEERWHIALQDLAEALDRTSKILATERDFVQSLLEHYHETSDFAATLHQGDLNTERRQLAVALNDLEVSRHTSRRHAFHLLQRCGYSTTDIARLWGISRQLVSRTLNKIDDSTTVPPVPR